MTTLHWLPDASDFRAALRAVVSGGSGAWPAAVALARTRLDLTRTRQLDDALRHLAPPPDARPVRLAVLGSCTTTHLLPSIRVAGLRRGLAIATHECAYGQYWQDLADPHSAMQAFRPDTVLLALDAHHLAAGVDARASAAEAEAALVVVQDRLRSCWGLARALGCAVIQQTPLPLHPLLLGGNEHRLPGSKAAFTARLSQALRTMADTGGVDLLALDERAGRDGLAAWHDPAAWHRAKQEVAPAAAPLHADLVARLIAARLGRSAKCLVLDADDTIWGGALGPDGHGNGSADRLTLGPGSAAGEAFAAVQAHARELSRRGIILAIVGHDTTAGGHDAAAVRAAFERHPEMVLRITDIAGFAAGPDRAASLRTIAARLNIGLDALVYASASPAARAEVRIALPMVAVPELGPDPATYPATLADGGWFEAAIVTADDRARIARYQADALRAQALAPPPPGAHAHGAPDPDAPCTDAQDPNAQDPNAQDSNAQDPDAGNRDTAGAAIDLDAYLRGLGMRLTWRRLDQAGLPRAAQLVARTNQFNLTARLRSEAELAALAADPAALALQLRLADRFGDAGVIAVVLARPAEPGDLLVDTWLMSCRVLGRGVERATLCILAAAARRLGARRLLGEYVASGRNAMVRNHYAGLGFTPLREDEQGSLAALDLAGFATAPGAIEIREG